MDLDEIAAAEQDQKQKSDQYRQALEQAVASGDAAACQRFVDHGAGSNGCCRGGLADTSQPGAADCTRHPPHLAPPALQCCPTRCRSCLAASCSWPLHRACRGWNKACSKRLPRSERANATSAPPSLPRAVRPLLHGALALHTAALPLARCSALDKVQPRAVSYEEQVSAVREHLAALYEGQEEWSKAAHALAGIDLDSGMRLLDAGDSDSAAIPATFPSSIPPSRALHAIAARMPCGCETGNMQGGGSLGFSAVH